MSMFYMFKFGERKVFPCGCHWYQCYHKVQDIERDLKRQPVILLKRIWIDDFKKVSKQSPYHLKNTESSEISNPCIIFPEHDKTEESNYNRTKINNQKSDGLGQFRHRPCFVQHTNKKVLLNKPGIHKVQMSNTFVSAKMLDRDALVIQDQESTTFKDGEEEQSLQNTKKEQLLKAANNQILNKGKRTSAETQGLTADMVNFEKKTFSKHIRDRDFVSLKLQAHEKQSKEFEVINFYRNCYKSQKQRTENSTDRKEKCSEESKDRDDPSLLSQTAHMQNENATAKHVETNVKEAQEEDKNTYLASNDKCSSAIESSTKHNYTISPCKVLLSSCLDSVICKQWKSVKENAVIRYFEKDKSIKNELTIGFHSRKRKRNSEVSEIDEDGDTTSWHSLTENNISSSPSSRSSSSSLLSINSPSNDSTYRSRKRLFDSIDHDNQINHFANSHRLARSKRYTGSYFFDDDYENNSDELVFVKPKKRRIQSLQRTYLSPKNEKKNIQVNETSRMFGNSVIKNEVILCENFSLSPCKVELKKLDLDKIQPSDNKVSRREFNDLSLIELFANSDMNMAQTYDAVEYRGRLRRNPKQRDSYASDWQRHTFVKRKQLMTKDFTKKKNSKWQKKREEKLRIETHSLRKSLDFINKRFVNQNSLRTLLLLERSVKNV